MKIISIRQPWATLIVLGHKDIENRSWPTNYRGPVLIHASKRPDVIDHKVIGRLYGLTSLPKEMPTGGVVGMAHIVDCVEKSKSPWFEPKFGFGFVLDRARRLPFVEWKGELGLRDAPNVLLRKIQRLCEHA